MPETAAEPEKQGPNDLPHSFYIKPLIWSHGLCALCLLLSGGHFSMTPRCHRTQVSKGQPVMENGQRSHDLWHPKGAPSQRVHEIFGGVFFSVKPPPLLCRASLLCPYPQPQTPLVRANTPVGALLLLSSTAPRERKADADPLLGLTQLRTTEEGTQGPLFWPSPGRFEEGDSYCFSCGNLALAK